MIEFTCTAFREEVTIDDMLMVEKREVEEEKFPYERALNLRKEYQFPYSVMDPTI
jgi:hypothetical protein